MGEPLTRDPNVYRCVKCRREWTKADIEISGICPGRYCRDDLIVTTDSYWPLPIVKDPKSFNCTKCKADFRSETSPSYCPRCGSDEDVFALTDGRWPCGCGSGKNQVECCHPELEEDCDVRTVKLNQSTS